MMRLAAIVFLTSLALTACSMTSVNPAQGPSTNTPDDTARAYFTALKQGDCQTVISLLSNKYKERLGGDPALDQWCTIATQHADIVPVSDVTVLAPLTTRENQAMVPVTFTNVAGSVQQVTVDTIKESNGWKVQDVRQAGTPPAPSPSP